MGVGVQNKTDISQKALSCWYLVRTHPSKFLILQKREKAFVTTHILTTP